ncbi:MAG: drug/metabolite transporter (DMT)-like permease [Hyphomicrobiaceae bacterium]
MKFSFEVLAKRLGVRQGVAYMIASAFAFSVMTLLVKIVGARLPSQEIVLVRALISLGLSWVLLRRAGISIWGKNPRLLVARGFVGFLALSCVYYSVTHNPLAEATIIQYLYPAITAALATLVLGERFPRRLLLAAPVSAVGLVLIAKPAFLFGAGVALDPVALWAAVVGAVLTSVAYVLVRQLAMKEHPLVIVFYFPLVTVPATLPFVMTHFVAPRGIEWLLLAGVGLATQAGQVWLTRGLQMESAGRAAATSYLQVIFATFWGALWFGQFPDGVAIVGGVLLVGATLAVALETDPA